MPGFDGVAMSYFEQFLVGFPDRFIDPCARALACSAGTAVYDTIEIAIEPYIKYALSNGFRRLFGI